MKLSSPEGQSIRENKKRSKTKQTYEYCNGDDEEAEANKAADGDNDQ